MIQLQWAVTITILASSTPTASFPTTRTVTAIYTHKLALHNLHENGANARLHSLRRSHPHPHPHPHRCTHLQSKRNRKETDRTADIRSPIETIIKSLSTPIGPTPTYSLPAIYPIGIILFNIVFNHMTSFVFDALFILFYLVLLQTVDVTEEDDGGGVHEETPAVMDAVTFFGAATSAWLISPLGFDVRDGTEGVLLWGLLPLGLLGVWWTLWKQNIVPEDVNDDDDDVDPSVKLMELWDNKMDQASKS